MNRTATYYKAPSPSVARAHPGLAAAFGAGLKQALVGIIHVIQAWNRARALHEIRHLSLPLAPGHGPRL